MWIFGLSYWRSHHFGPLDPEKTLRIVIPGFVSLTLGVADRPFELLHERAWNGAGDEQLRSMGSATTAGWSAARKAGIWAARKHPRAALGRADPSTKPECSMWVAATGQSTSSLRNGCPAFRSKASTCSFEPTAKIPVRPFDGDAPHSVRRFQLRCGDVRGRAAPHRRSARAAGGCAARGQEVILLKDHFLEGFLDGSDAAFHGLGGERASRRGFALQLLV